MPAPANSGQTMRDSNCLDRLSGYARNSQSSSSSPVTAIDVTLRIQTTTVGGEAPRREFQRFPLFSNAGTKSTSRMTTIGHESASASAQKTSGNFQCPGNAHFDPALFGIIAPQSAASHMALNENAKVPNHEKKMAGTKYTSERIALVVALPRSMVQR